MPKVNPKEKTTFTAREVGVLIEEFRNQFRIFGEGQEALIVKIDAMMGMVAKNQEDITMLNIRINGIKTDIVGIKSEIVEIKTDINKMNGRLFQIEEDVRITKNDTRTIKEDLKIYDKRITHLEAIK